MRLWQIAHHLIAHPLMVVLPDRWGTWFHDETAKRAWPEEVEYDENG